MPTTPNKRPDDEVCNKESAMRCVPCEILCCEKHVTPHKEKGRKLVKPGEPESEIVFATNINHIQVDQRDELARLREQLANLTVENAELRNRGQHQVESFTALLEEIYSNRQLAGRDSTSSRPIGAAASPVDDVNLEPGSNTNPETQLYRSHSEQVKKTTEILCKHFFTPEELSSKTLTGKGKGRKADEDHKLDEKRVSAIVDAVEKIYPGQGEELIRNHIAAILNKHQQRERRSNEGNDKQK